jgi:hypothetical protein
MSTSTRHINSLWAALLDDSLVSPDFADAIAECIVTGNAYLQVFVLKIGMWFSNLLKSIM